MYSHEATLIYAKALPNGSAKLRLDLFPAIQSSYGAQHDAFVSQFRLLETHEVGGLVSLRGEATLRDLLGFLGSCWQQALDRWPELAAMVGYRQKHGTDAYACVETWFEFYQLLADQVMPDRIELASIEQP
ncbi:MAG: hypothetical protein ACTHL8_11185 [Burkholderiaceae bacterium]